MPGMDGTGFLFATLLDALGETFKSVVISYPPDLPLNYDMLAERVMQELPTTPFMLLAESFSGPVALRVAAQNPPGLKALILSASFAGNPHPWLFRMFGWCLGRWCFRLSMPASLIRALLAGPGADVLLVEDVRKTVRISEPSVMLSRLKMIAKANAKDLSWNIAVPFYYLNGTKDHLVGPFALQQMVDQCPDVTVIDVPGPHMLLQREPDVCAEHIRNIAAQLESGD